MTKRSKAARLRELIAQGCVMLPGVPNAALARQVERTGFDAVYISGAGMANATAGAPDIGLLALIGGGRVGRLHCESRQDPGDCRRRYGHWRGGECRTHHSRTGKGRPGWLSY